MNTDKQDPAEQPSKPQLTQRNYQSVIDQIIGQAMAEGQFDQLPGQGQPLALDDDSMVPEEDRLGFRMLKTHGFAPPWIEARRDIDRTRAEIADWLARTNQRWPYTDSTRRQALQTEYRRKLEQLQQSITNYNLRTPAASAHLPGLHIQDELAKLGV